jgi:hypothetical protein
MARAAATMAEQASRISRIFILEDPAGAGFFLEAQNALPKLEALNNAHELVAVALVESDDSPDDWVRWVR